MKWFILFIGLVVICFMAAMVLGLIGGGMGNPVANLSHEPLPEHDLSDSDFDELTFDVTARGYRMSQVDGVVDRLRRELREKDAELRVLRHDLEAGPRSTEPVALEAPLEAPFEDPPGPDNVNDTDDAHETEPTEAGADSTA